MPEESPFEIDAIGGEIRTRNSELDFERQPVHYLTVTANDGAKRGTERMADTVIFQAQSILTMNPGRPRATGLPVANARRALRASHNAMSAEHAFLADPTDSTIQGRLSLRSSGNY